MAIFSEISAYEIHNKPRIPKTMDPDTLRRLPDLIHGMAKATRSSSSLLTQAHSLRSVIQTLRRLGNTSPRYLPRRFQLHSHPSSRDVRRALTSDRFSTRQWRCWTHWHSASTLRDIHHFSRRRLLYRVGVESQSTFADRSAGRYRSGGFDVRAFV